MNHSVVEIVFKVSAKLNFGEELRVSGNTPALGCEDPERAVPLVTSPADYPWWRTKEAIILPGDKDAVRYRYGIYSGGKFRRWEGNGKMYRHLHGAASEKIVKATTDHLGAVSADELDASDDGLNSSPGLGNTSVIAAPEVLSFRSRQFAEWSKRSTIDNSLSSQDGVIIVSYFLPVILSKSSSGKWSAAWDGENILSLSLNDARATWVGSVRYLGAPIPVDEEEAVTEVLAQMNCHPIFINQNTHYQFYELFCKQSLWMLLHHVVDVYGPLNTSEIGAKGQQDLWFTYSTVSRVFRDKVVEVYQPGDLVWIHGFHLMLLPSFLRRTMKDSKIGFFFHTPFPSSEIWRTLNRREDLLRGVLAADQIGFHLFEYARQFMTSCHRELGHNSNMNPAGKLTVNVDGREVAITCIHTGVDLPRVKQALTANTFEHDVMAWKTKFPGKTIVAGIDRLERLKGIPLKLMAIEEFLQENPQWRKKLVFTLIGISAHERGDDYRQTQHDLRVIIDRINKKFAVGPNEPVVYFEERHEKENGLAQRLAFFAASDVLMITPPRDGLNRFPMEFTLAKQRAGQLPTLSEQRTEGSGLPGQGLVIISEFVSSARVMRGALIVNPWKISDVKIALKHSLEMRKTERADRMRRNLEFSNRLTTLAWAMQVLEDLKSVEKVSEGGSHVAVGFGMGFRVMGVKAGFDTLDVVACTRAYRSAKYRLIVLDWGGTLVAETDKVDKLQAYALATGQATRSGPTEALKATLEDLCADVKNVVFVVSGKELMAVSEFFGDVDGLGLGAEHGFYYKWPRDELVTDMDAKWATIHAIGDQTWKLAAKLVMDIYVQRTHGTYIEQKGNALIWQFRDADPEFGFLQSKELEENLKEVMHGYSVEVIRGGGVADGYIEVRPAGISKGLFLSHAIAKMKAIYKDPDFIMCIGDDSSDEPMFEQLSGLSSVEGLNAFSVTVGKKPSSATAYVDDPTAVMEVLNSLVKTTQREKEKRYYSSVDLPSQGLSERQSIIAKANSSLSEKSSSGVGRAASASNLLGNELGASVAPRRTVTINAPSVSFAPPAVTASESGGSSGGPSPRSQAPRRNESAVFKQFIGSIDEDEHENEGGGIYF